MPENELPDCGRLTTSSDYDDTKKEEKELRKAINESKKMHQSSGLYYNLCYNNYSLTYFLLIYTHKYYFVNQVNKK